MGGRTGGRSNEGLGTSGGVVEGIGFGDGICRNASPNALWIDEWVGDGGIANCLRGIAWCNGIGFRGDVIDFVTVESFRWRLAERDDWDSAKSRDKNDRNAIVSRRGWRVK